LSKKYQTKNKLSDSFSSQNSENENENENKNDCNIINQIIKSKSPLIKRRENIIITNNFKKTSLIGKLNKSQNEFDNLKEDFSYYLNKNSDLENPNKNSNSLSNINTYLNNENENNIKSQVEFESIKSEESKRSNSSDSEISNQYYKDDNDYPHNENNKDYNDINRNSIYTKSEFEKNTLSEYSIKNNLVFWSKEKFEIVREKLKIVKNLLIQKEINEFDELYILIDSDENEKFL